MNRIAYIILVLLFWGIVIAGAMIIQWQLCIRINKANNRYRKYHVSAVILLIFGQVKAVIECIKMIEEMP